MKKYVKLFTLSLLLGNVNSPHAVEIEARVATISTKLQSLKTDLANKGEINFYEQEQKVYSDLKRFQESEYHKIDHKLSNTIETLKDSIHSLTGIDWKKMENYRECIFSNFLALNVDSNKTKDQYEKISQMTADMRIEYLKYMWINNMEDYREGIFSNFLALNVDSNKTKDQYEKISQMTADVRIEYLKYIWIYNLGLFKKKINYENIIPGIEVQDYERVSYEIACINSLYTHAKEIEAMKKASMEKAAEENKKQGEALKENLVKEDAEAKSNFPEKAADECLTLEQNYDKGTIESNGQQAVAIYHSAAIQLDLSDQNKPGDIYILGESGVKQNPLTGAHLKNVDSKNFEPQYLNFNSGKIFEQNPEGEGDEKQLEPVNYSSPGQSIFTERDSEESIEVIIESFIGLELKDPSSDDEEINRLIKTAAQGDANAQNNLGVMYAVGKGVEKDLKKAVEYYKQAADLGHQKAQFNLAWMYALGLGGEQNYNIAFIWFEKAADQGLVEAKFNLGVMYENGWGVEKNLIKARNNFHLAADLDHKRAQYFMGDSYERGENGLIKNEKDAFFYYNKAAHQNEPRALRRLVDVYLLGDLGQAQDVQKGSKLLEAAELQKNVNEKEDKARLMSSLGEEGEKNLSRENKRFLKFTEGGYMNS